MSNQQTTVTSPERRDHLNEEAKPEIGAGRVSSPGLATQEEATVPATEYPEGDSASAGTRRPEDPKGSPDYRGHAIHLTRCLHDAYGLRESVSLVSKLEARFRELDQKIPLDRLLKWFYGQGLSLSVGIAPAPLEVDGVLYKSLRPIVRLLFGSGRMGRFVKNLLIRARHRAACRSLRKKAVGYSIGQTLLQMKKGTPVVSEATKIQSMEKHRKALEEPVLGLHSRVAGCADEDKIALDDRLERSVRHTVREVFQGRTFKLKEGSLLHFPSLSAHYHSKRSDGGAASFIVDGWYHQTVVADDGRWEEVTFPRPDGTLWQVKYHPDQEHTFLEWVRMTVEREEREGFMAQPMAILEPLKVRIITKGPEVSYWICTVLQKFMWNVIKSHPTFELVGKTISEEVVERLLIDLQKDAKFLSGDYSAASDNLRSFLSRAAIQEVCEVAEVPDWLSKLAESCLCDHHLSSKSSAVPMDFISRNAWKQSNGQLMGSPLSFPILCLVNAAICRLPFRKGSLRNLPMKINGDDCVMAYNKKQKEEWEVLASAAGLEPSVGKCYYSGEFLQMNSETFLLGTDDLGFKSFYRVPYLNFGHTKPVSAKGNNPRSFVSLGAVGRDFISGSQSSNPRIKDALPFDAAVKCFVRRQHKLLSEAPVGVSWFLPKAYGGLGIPARESRIASHVTEEQLKLASYLRRQLEQGVSVSVFGSTREGIHPYVSKALDAVRHWETVTVEQSAEQGPLDWAELGEEDDFWAATTRLDVYTPLLWALAQVDFFERHNKRSPKAHFEASEEAKGLITVLDLEKSKMGKGTKAEKEIENLSPNAKWYRLRRKAGATSATHTLHDLLVPLKLTRYIPEEYLRWLADVVPGPRNTIASFLAPGHLPCHSPSEDTLTELEQRAWLCHFTL